MEKVLRTALVGVLASGACGGDDGGARPDDALVRDSAGVTIVTSGPDGEWDADEGWSLREVVSLGAVDGPEASTWGSVVGLLPRPDGGVVVADGQAAEIRFFDAGGRHVATSGGRGQGPGEFDHIAAVTALHDTVAVWDWSLRKLALFDFDGRFLGSRPFTADYFEVGRPEHFRGLRGGDVLVVARTSCRIPRRETDTRWRVSLVSGDGSTVRLLRERPLTEVVPVYGPPGTFCVLAHPPFPRRDMLAVLPSGELAHADGSDYRIDVYAGPDDPGFADVEAAAPDAGTDEAAAGPGRSIRRRAPDLPVTDRALELHRRRQRERDLSEAKLRLVMEALDERPRPGSRPPLDRLLADDAGRLWARRTPDLADATAAWDVFDPDGIFLGQVELPARLEVEAVANGRAYGVVTDELGVEVVKIYRILDPSP